MTAPDFHRTPQDEPIVSTVVFDGALYVATTRRVYRLDGDRLVPLKFGRHEGPVTLGVDYGSKPSVSKKIPVSFEA